LNEVREEVGNRGRRQPSKLIEREWNNNYRQYRDRIGFLIQINIDRE